MTKRVHLVMTGRVQGVFYRASMEAEARRLGLAGWVRNLPDGRVEAIAEGPEEALKALEDWAEIGPPEARVEAIAATWYDATGEFEGFGVRR